jgi:hypothetical protein
VVRAGYGLLGARFGAAWDKYQLSRYFKNITDVIANLGDINPVSYVRTLPNEELDRRVAVQRPFQVGLEFSYGM